MQGPHGQPRNIYSMVAKRRVGEIGKFVNEGSQASDVARKGDRGVQTGFFKSYPNFQPAVYRSRLKPAVTSRKKTAV
jgi:hypothetical protein